MDQKATAEAGARQAASSRDSVTDNLLVADRAHFWTNDNGSFDFVLLEVGNSVSALLVVRHGV